MKRSLIVLILLFSLLSSIPRTHAQPDIAAPTYSDFTYNETRSPRYPCNFSVTLVDLVMLDSYIFGWDKGTGWVNDTAVNMGGVPFYNADTVKLLPLNDSINVQARYWFNDTANNWGRTNLLNFDTTSAVTPTGFSLLLVMAALLGLLTFLGVRR